jgi:DNA mismatch repair protein MutS2
MVVRDCTRASPPRLPHAPPTRENAIMLSNATPDPAGAADIAPDKTRSDLEWSRLLDALARRCEGSAARDLAHELGPIEDKDELHRTIREVGEAMRTLAEGEPLPVPALPDARAAHDRAGHGGVLGPVELRALAEVLAAARTLRRFLHARREALPALEAALSTDATLDRVEEEIARAFEPDGTLADHASPQLRALRGEYAAGRARMISRIEELMRRHAPILQDGFWTEREGRYVLPVRSDAHERFPGIVHAASGSGATLFVEPRVLVPLGNRLKMLEGEVRREEEAIYARLTARVVDQLPSVGAALEATARADLLAAIARLARDLDLRFPELPSAEEGFVAQLHALRHPLLVIEALESPPSAPPKRVVPSDVAVAGGNALVVSGPNAGGKTVALKALGLAALMLRSGLPIAAAEGSKLGVVEAVLSDVGDDQSITKNLSTFSAHITNIARILDAAHAGALVLLDELAGGTDPREGEALAAAVLDGLCRRGAAVVATTHYEGLKALALADPRFRNASVGFDEKTLSPTFELALGVPGASSALAVAKRFGIPSLVVERAESYLSGEDRSFEETVRALNDERRGLALARAATEAEHAEARQLKVRLEGELEALRARDRRIVHHEAEQLLVALRRARDDLREAQARLRAKKPEQADVTTASRAVDAVASRFAIGGDFAAIVEGPTADRGERLADEQRLHKGAKVYVPRLRADAEVLEVLSDGQLRVSAGALKLTVARSDVRVIVDAPTKDAAGRAIPGRAAPRQPRLRSSHMRSGQTPARPAAASPGLTPIGEDVVLQTGDNTCDLRGLRTDDAWPMLETFLDRAMHEGQRAIVVVHGHGSGAVRDRVRDELKRSRYVERFRAGRQDEGGDGVTVVWLA